MMGAGGKEGNCWGKVTKCSGTIGWRQFPVAAGMEGQEGQVANGGVQAAWQTRCKGAQATTGMQAEGRQVAGGRKQEVLVSQEV